MKHNQIQYIEFLTNNFDSVKQFYSNAFGWEFTDWGSDTSLSKGKQSLGGLESVTQ